MLSGERKKRRLPGVSLAFPPKAHSQGRGPRPGLLLPHAEEGPPYTKVAFLCAQLTIHPRVMETIVSISQCGR